jgi:thiamine biosynthesis protein ThiC
MESLQGDAKTGLYRDMVDVFVYDAAARIRKYALDTTYSFAFGEVRNLLEKGISHFTTVAGVNVKEARRKIADRLIDENKYCF